MKYYLVIDASQGERKGADSFTACVAHAERRNGKRIAVQDALFEAMPPFSPSDVLAQIAALAQRYRIQQVHGDPHARGFIAEILREHGLTFVELERTKSDLLLDALAMLNSGQAILLDHPKQRRQILSLRRQLHAGGRVSVDHQRGGHDDVANAGLAALVVAVGVHGKQPRRQLKFSFGDGMSTPENPTGIRGDRAAEQHDPMLDLIARTKAYEERAAEADWLISKAASAVAWDGPMLGEMLRGEAYDDLALRIGEPSPTLDRSSTLKRGGER